MLEARGLCKSYGERAVVADLSLTVAAGEIVGLLGPNGAGKSTTVAMLCGLVGADRGEVFVGTGASRLALDENANAAKRRIGVVPQELSIYENLGAAANLELFGALYGLAGALLRERVATALALVGLADRAKDKPQSFSGGMKRRLNIAAALVHDPDVLIFDEPTVGVDPQSRNAIFDNLESLRDRGKALLYTTHYMEEAERLCDRVVIMDHGRVVASDTLAGLHKRLPAVETIELEVDGVVDLDALGRLPGIAGPTQDGAHLHAGVADLGRAAPALLTWLAEHGHAVHRISSGRADLEDVFLSLTGRQLRD
ncbi:MAG TPA: ABC transporter ATP-binding protein [Caldimonas sp.]|jgi:ABC-2 type transport system ATP-binding protein|nr:ABC transporter ATP-binding protein [Caldimonas sp.]